MSEEFWQLKMFRRSLKKRLKVKALTRHFGDLAGKRCLSITCGDNTGSLNYFFIRSGGSWLSADLEEGNLCAMREVVGGGVMQMAGDSFPFRNGIFDLVVAVDVLEHISTVDDFVAETKRILLPGGTAILTTPSGDSRLLMNKLKCLLGMTPQRYGHVRAGFTQSELAHYARRNGLTVLTRSGYSRAFTELVELVVNLGYVTRKGVGEGKIAPTSKEELRRHGSLYKVYSVVFPFLQMISAFDHLLPAAGVYASVVVAQKG